MIMMFMCKVGDSALVLSDWFGAHAWQSVERGADWQGATVASFEDDTIMDVVMFI